MVIMDCVIALGGNAIYDASNVDKVADEIAAQYMKGNRIALTHGNGPQVGALFDKHRGNLSTLTTETQREIGAKLKGNIELALKRHGINPRGIVRVVLTQVIVNKRDRAFSRPSKPIGRFMDSDEAKVAKDGGMAVMKLIGGYRMVVPSPIPKEIVQIRIIKELLKMSRIVIACGGGGAAVTKSGSRLVAADAVIDKDRASAILARSINADSLIILTNVDGAFLNYKKKGQKFIGNVTSKTMAKYARDGQFEDGSMKPKVEACINFVNYTGKPACIGSLFKPHQALSMRGVTAIRP